ncbi:sigma factor [Nonomuraea sp. NPDC001684]
MTSHPEAAPGQDRFTAETERFRRELLAHCYRMVGSAQDAEDLVQETYLRAWRSYSGFEGRASIRSWLYTIATNVCLTALKPRPIRVLPSGLTGPYDGLDRPPSPVAPAEILGTTTAAVKSGLQRARARLDELEPEPAELLEPADPRARALLDGYIAAFERSDVGLLEQVLRVDATLEATPFRDWQSGRATCLHVLDAYVLGTPGDWRMIATTANGHPSAVVYHRDADGVLRADGVVVLTPTATGIARVIKFHDPALVTTFGFPDALMR